MILNLNFRFCWYLVMRKIVRRNPLLAFKCFILLFMISSPKNIFHVLNILFTSNNISHSNCYVSLTLWGDWVCESLVSPSDGFSGFSAYPKPPSWTLEGFQNFHYWLSGARFPITSKLSQKVAFSHQIGCSIEWIVFAEASPPSHYSNGEQWVVWRFCCII